MGMSLAERFWPKVQKAGSDDCWLWLAAKDNHGYGLLNHNGKRLRAHRVSYELEHGTIEACEGYHGGCVLHRCDNPSCVNPRHLFTGDHQENMEDMAKKGRAAKLSGNSHWSKRLKNRLPEGDDHWSHKEPDKVSRGEQNGNTKLTSDDVIRLRTLHASKTHTQKELAGLFCITQTAVSAIVRRKTWRHI